MSWRDSAIEAVLEYEFCGLWDSLPSVELQGSKDVKRRIAERRLVLEKLDDNSLIEEALYSSRMRGYDRGGFD